MIAKVSDQGLTIPKEMLAGMDQVQIRREDNKVIVTPLGEVDPIWKLGEDPYDGLITDGSVNHDKYIYDL